MKTTFTQLLVIISTTVIFTSCFGGKTEEPEELTVTTDHAEEVAKEETPPQEVAAVQEEAAPTEESSEEGEPTEAPIAAESTSSGQEVDTNEVAMPPPVESMPMQQAEDIPAAVAAPEAAPQAEVVTYDMPTSGRVVLYSKKNNTKIFSETNKNSKVIGVLEQGDHELVEVQGEWARLNSGHFVMVKELSRKAIPRSMPGKLWRKPAA